MTFYADKRIMKRYLYILAALLLATSCSSGDNGGEEDYGEVSFVLTTTDDGTTSSPAEGTSVGLYVYDENTSSFVSANGLAMVGNNGALMGAPSLPANGRYTVYAYIPYHSEWGEAVTTPQRFEVYSDQSKQSNYDASDLTVSKSTVSGGQTTMDFQHLMANVVVHITDQTGTNNLEGSNTHVVMKEMATAVMLTLKDGVVSTDDSQKSDIQMLTLDQTTRRISASAIVVPQEKKGGTTLFTLYLDGQQYLQFSLDESENLQSGKSYIYRLLLTEEGLVVDSTQITDWLADAEESILNTDDTEN